jgi:two-component sensor histidine kinase
MEWGLAESFQSLCQSSMGIRLVNILADQLDAQLQVQSQPQQGTQFYLTFNAQSPQEASV